MRERRTSYTRSPLCSLWGFARFCSTSASIRAIRGVLSGLAPYGVDQHGHGIPRSGVVAAAPWTPPVPPGSTILVTHGSVGPPAAGPATVRRFAGEATRRRRDRSGPARGRSFAPVCSTTIRGGHRSPNSARNRPPRERATGTGKECSRVSVPAAARPGGGDGSHGSARSAPFTGGGPERGRESPRATARTRLPEHTARALTGTPRSGARVEERGSWLSCRFVVIPAEHRPGITEISSELGIRYRSG